MLVINRKSGESIHIGEDIRIVILKTGRNSVRLGIQAPKTTTVLRTEILPKEVIDKLPKDTTSTESQDD